MFGIKVSIYQVEALLFIYASVFTKIETTNFNRIAHVSYSHTHTFEIPFGSALSVFYFLYAFVSRVRSQIPSPSHRILDSLPARLPASQSFINSIVICQVFAVTTQHIHSNLLWINETAWQNHPEIFYFYRIENEAVSMRRAFECVINRA